MAIVLIPNFGSELVQGLARHIPAVRFQLVDPNYELVSLGLRERQDAIFQFSYAHHEYGDMDRSLLQARRRPPDHHGWRFRRSIPGLNWVVEL